MLAPAQWERLARLEHRRWMADRIDRGWRFGETRDARNRRHPSLVPWEALGETERSKDLEVVRVLLNLAST